MSMYDLMFKRHPMAPELLGQLLELDARKIGRIRDCYPVMEPIGEIGTIHVFTRLGGGNRAEYQEAIEYLRAAPGYVKDYDEDIDSTYATFEFRTDGSIVFMREMKDEIIQHDEALLTKFFYAQTFRERFDEAMAAMRDPNNARGQEIIAAARPVMEKIQEAMVRGDGAVISVDGDALRQQLEERGKKH